jgi:hypothetical protein
MGKRFGVIRLELVAYEPAWLTEVLAPVVVGAVA